MSETDPSGSQGFDWDFVYNYKSSSAVAVDPYWIITAAHVADDGGTGNLSIGATTYNQQEIVYHPNADLALVRYDQALPDYYQLYDGSFSPGVDLLMVGFGNTGTTSVTTYSDSGSGAGTKRWGLNEFTNSTTVNYNAGGTTGLTSTVSFFMDFNSASLTEEAGVGINDSGGGTFIDDSGTWKLAGINFTRPQVSPGNYTGTNAASIPDYESWIVAVVPELPTWMLAGGFLTLMVTMKRFYS